MGDLISSMRSGGGAGVQAAREFLQLARGGGVTGAQVREVQKLITSPELADQFAGVAGEFNALLAGGGEGVFRDVQALAPNTKQLKDPKAIPERFLGDLTMVEHQLLQHPGLTRAQKAERLFQFFENYVQRFHELTQGTAQQQQAAEAFQSPLSPAELQKVMALFDKALTRAGFQHLVASDGRTGTQAAKELLDAKTLAELKDARPKSLDAPSWKDNPALPKPATGANPQLQLPAQRLTAQQLEEQKKKEEEARRGRNTSNKVLGGRMVWNVLHLLRGDDLTDVEKKDALNQLIIAAALVLVFVAIVVGVLVATA